MQTAGSVLIQHTAHAEQVS